MMHTVEWGVRSSEWKRANARKTLSTPSSELRTIYSRGFTLLEVMVAVSIMAMVLVSLLGLKNRSMQDVALAEHITTATILAKRTMVDVLFSRPRQPAEDEGTFPEEEYKDYTWKKMVTATPFVQLMEVRVAVFWKEGERPEMVELVSYE
jgi:general secretion pathway protein I